MIEETLARAVRPVPFLDLRALNGGLKEEILEDLGGVIDSSRFLNAPQVASFEESFAAYCGAQLCVGTASGLDALRIGLLAAGLEPGEEVVVPAMTFVATYEAVTQAGGRPRVVDISEEDYNVDRDAVAATITPRTRFLLPVHLYGQLADMRSLLALAAEDDLVIVEDACQAHGAVRDGIRAGASGRAAAFSFYPAKNLGAMGDAGALVTSDDAIDAEARALREHGQTSKYRHMMEGYTSRLDTFQAVVLARKLPHLDGWNAERRAVAALYGELLDGLGDLRLPPVPRGSQPVWHLYVVRTAERDALSAYLARLGIETGLHYPEPPPHSQAYSSLGHVRGEFPVAESLAGEALSLPLFPGMTQAQVEAVASALADYFARG